MFGSLRKSECGLIHNDDLRDLLLGDELRKLPESGHFQEQK
jgi:hypothetical protein